jgi:transcriptional regulator with XRE-family HTH domain
VSSFSERLVLLRESRELKKKDLAELLNVSASCISQYEKGTSMPGYDVLLRLSQYFDVSLDFLLASDSDTRFNLSNVYDGNITYLSLLRACENIPVKNRQALLSVVNALQEVSNRDKRGD